MSVSISCSRRACCSCRGQEMKEEGGTMAGSGRVRRTRPSGGLTHARLVSGLTCSHGHLGPPGVGQLLARAVLGVWCKGGGGLGGPGASPPSPVRCHRRAPSRLATCRPYRVVRGVARGPVGVVLRPPVRFSVESRFARLLAVSGSDPYCQSSQQLLGLPAAMSPSSPPASSCRRGRPWRCRRLPVKHPWHRL